MYLKIITNGLSLIIGVIKTFGKVSKSLLVGGILLICSAFGYHFINKKDD